MKQTKRLLAILLCLALALGAMSACQSAEHGPAASELSSQTQSVKDLRVTAIKGPTGVGIAQLMLRTAVTNTQTAYKFSIAQTPDEVVSQVISGDFDIASVPTNLAATLYAKTGGKIQLLAVNTLGVLNIVENGTSIVTIQDIRGKTIFSSGQGANPEYILRYVLEKNGINPDTDVNIEFVSTNEELAVKISSTPGAVALVPEPTATTIASLNNNLHAFIDIDDVWKEINNGSSLMMGCIIARKELVEQHPALIQAFLGDYKASAENVEKELEYTLQLAIENGIVADNTVRLSISRCDVVYIAAQEAKDQLNSYLKVLFDYNPASVGGALPDDGFYYAPPAE